MPLCVGVHRVSLWLHLHHFPFTHSISLSPFIASDPCNLSAHIWCYIFPFVRPVAWFISLSLRLSFGYPCDLVAPPSPAISHCPTLLLSATLFALPLFIHFFPPVFALRRLTGHMNVDTQALPKQRTRLASLWGVVNVGIDPSSGFHDAGHRAASEKAIVSIKYISLLVTRVQKWNVIDKCHSFQGRIIGMKV